MFLLNPSTHGPPLDIVRVGERSTIPLDLLHFAVSTLRLIYYSLDQVAGYIVVVVFFIIILTLRFCTIHCCLIGNFTDLFSLGFLLFQVLFESLLHCFLNDYSLTCPVVCHDLAICAGLIEFVIDAEAQLLL